MTSTQSARTAADPAASLPDRFAAAVDLAGDVIAPVGMDLLDRPTPCPGMNVRDLLGHLVMALQRSAAAGRGEDPETWPTEPTGVDDWAWADLWRAVQAPALAAWADPATLGRDTRLPWGVVTGADALGVYLNEITVHTWDLARATGQEPRWDDAVVGAAFDAIREAMPAEGRAEMFAAARAGMAGGDDSWDDPFGPAVAVGDEAPLVERLVAWNGRRP